MTEVIIYWIGALVSAALLGVFTAIVAGFITASTRHVVKEIMAYRRASYIRYWSSRMEREGLLAMDKHYREVAQGRKPKNLLEANAWEAEALRKDQENE